MRSANPGSLAAFTLLDWGLLAGVALMWGSTFVLIDLGLDQLHPATVAWMRLLFGAATLACLPGARRSVPSADWPWIALLGCVWMAGPFLLFPFAQQWVASSLAGMINGAAPLFTAAVAVAWSRRLPGNRQLAGIVIGFVGVLALYLPTMQGAQATTVGAAMILLATLMYGVAFNLAEPLQRRLGALPVIWRAQLVALAILTPSGLFGMADTPPSGSGVALMAILGVFSTGLGFAMFITLVGRVGASRGSITVYFVPVVAIFLGVLFRDEVVTPLALAGTAVVLLGAYLTSRAQGAPARRSRGGAG